MAPLGCVQITGSSPTADIITIAAATTQVDDERFDIKQGAGAIAQTEAIDTFGCRKIIA
jgi:hypothetical protein